MIRGLPKNFQDVINSNGNLSKYLSNLSKGREFTPSSWLYEDVKDKKAILDRWKTQLDVLRNGTNYEQEVFQFDTSQEEKWGPQGGIAPIKELMDDVVMPTFLGAVSPRPKAFSTNDWHIAKESVIAALRKHQVFGIRSASYNRVVDDMRARDTLESNSGWPDFTRRNKPGVSAEAIAAASDGRWVDYPAIALFRNYRQKTRLVWMFPMAANVFEGSLYQPLQSAIIKNGLSFYVPWVGFEAVRDRITEAYAKGQYIAASDFSNTDAHFQTPASMECFDVLAQIVDRTEVGRLRLSLKRMHEIPLLIGVDEMLTGKHGVSSGSNWTNFIETVFDNIFGEYVGKTGTYKPFYAIGDDMAWVSDKYSEDFSQDLEQLGKEVGQDVKAEKTTNDENKVKTLQRLFQRGFNRPDGKCRGVYSTIRALNSSIFPERYHKPKDWSSDMFCARQYMILENCVDHPLFEEFVKFVVAGHKDLIPFAKKTRRQLDQILRKTKLLPGLNPTYNQEKRDHSLADFEAIAIARNL